MCLDVEKPTRKTEGIGYKVFREHDGVLHSVWQHSDLNGYFLWGYQPDKVDEEGFFTTEVKTSSQGFYVFAKRKDAVVYSENEVPKGHKLVVLKVRMKEIVMAGATNFYSRRRTAPAFRCKKIKILGKWN